MTQPMKSKTEQKSASVVVAAAIAGIMLVGGAVVIQAFFYMLLAGAVHSAFNSNILGVPWSFGQAVVACIVLDVILALLRSIKNS